MNITQLFQSRQSAEEATAEAEAARAEAQRRLDNHEAELTGVSLDQLEEWAAEWRRLVDLVEAATRRRDTLAAVASNAENEHDKRVRGVL
jgi:hypothetical protein